MSEWTPTAGDHVALKSGGPRMTVEVVEYGLCHCIWSDKRDQVHRQAFQAAALQKYVVPRPQVRLAGTRKGL